VSKILSVVLIRVLTRPFLVDTVEKAKLKITKWYNLFAFCLLLSGLFFGLISPKIALAAPCDPPVTNPILCENSIPGNPSSEWDITASGSANIAGFASDISINKGDTINFKVDTNSNDYRIDIYRIGYYAGLGARKIDSILPSATLPQTQPACLTNPTEGLTDCGNWATSASWSAPVSAVSGVYIAKLVRQDATPGSNHIIFIIRDDTGNSDMLFQTSDTTWQAYNAYGGKNLYNGAHKVSYNRPFITRGDQSGKFGWFFSSEYPMVRFLEANGYNVSYFTGVDSDRRGNLIKNHRVFLSVGHDEYWSGNQRANVESARDSGVNLGFFSGNEMFWKTRWENSIDGTNTNFRTLVTYKETSANSVIDPFDPPIWTGTWRDPRFSPPADGGRPENTVSGTWFRVNGTRNDAITVPFAYSGYRIWRNTTVANLQPGQTATFPLGTLGYEWDESVDNGFAPAGLVKLSATTLNLVGYYLLDYGSTYGSGTATHSLTLYKKAGALVFGAGTVQWAWGLDNTHDNFTTSTVDSRMQQATVNLFADMGVTPATLIPGLAPAAASSDTTPPVSIITSPVSGATISGQLVISGTASDSGGVVGGIEVSTDSGVTWHQATGTTAWSYSWTPIGSGTFTLKSRAVDDSGNIEVPSAGISVSTSYTITSFQINSGGDDVNEDGSNYASNGPTIFLGTAATVGGGYTGLRFNNVNIPPGSTITSAHLEVVSPSTAWNQLNFDIYGEATGSSTLFSSTSKPSQRSLTTAKVAHASDANWLSGSTVSFNEMKTVVQEVINNPSWQSGNSLSVILKGTGGAWNRKFVTSFEGSSTNAPKLVIAYQGSGGPQPTPTPSPSPTPTPTPTPAPSPTPTPTPTPQPGVPVSFQINSGKDDVNEDGTIYTGNGTSIFLGTGGTVGGGWTGLRFNNVSIPVGATITSAHLEVVSPSTAWNQLNFDIYGEANGNSTTFFSTSKPSGRPLTVSKVSHTSNVNWPAGSTISLNEIKTVVQEVINNPSWQAGNSLSIILKGTGGAWSRKFVSSFEGSAVNAPKLVVTYQ